MTRSMLRRALDHGVSIRTPLAIRWLGSTLIAATLLPRSSWAQGDTADSGAPTREVDPASGGSNATLTLPVLKKFVPADYPSEAEAQGQQGTVVLKLDVDADGRVTGAVVAEPAGHGFDEAAVAAARQFVFEPATRAGVPIRARILYRYSFALSARASAPSGSAPSSATSSATSPIGSEPPLAQPTGGGGVAIGDTRPAPGLGQLRGSVLGDQPARPLASAHVRIASKQMPTFDLATDKNGAFVTAGLPPGKYAVQIEAGGYEILEVSEEIAVDMVTSVRYELVPIASPVEVLVRGVPAHREVSRYAITREELKRLPGTFGDAIHAIEAMPSVGRTRPFTGDLVIRGSGPQDTQVFIDGTYVPRVFHYGALSSVVPTEMIERLELYPGNFSARFGRGMGGVVDVALRKTSPDGKYHGSAQIDFINARANAEGPIPGLSGWSFMGGLRGSYVNAWLAPVMRGTNSAIPAIPQYYDYQAYVEKELGPGAYCRIGAFGAIDRYVAIEKTRQASDFPENSFGNVQALLRLPFGKGFRWDSTLALGYSHQRSPSDSDSQNTTDFKLLTARSELSSQLFGFGALRLGADVEFAPFDVQQSSPQKSTGGALAYAPTSDANLIVHKLHGEYFRPAGYAEVELSPSRRVQNVFGVRADYTHDTDRWDFAPRWTGRVELVPGPRKTALKAGAGVFYQPPAPADTLPELGYASLRSERAIHGMLGVEQGITDSIELSVEGFGKDLTGLLVSGTDDGGRYTVTNSGSGSVIGVDLLLRYRPDSRFFGWISYTLSRSMRRDFEDRPLLHYTYDQPHLLNVVASYRLGRGWEIGGRFRFMSGFIYSACDGGIFNNATGRYSCYGPRVQDRLAPFHQLDLRAEKTWQFADWKLSFYADIINAYYHNSPDYAVRRYDYSKTEPESFSFPWLPSLGLRGEF